MTDRSHGYNISVGYTYGFCREMAPDWLDLAAQVAGHAPPRAPGTPFRYLELGSGQGVGLCLLAAANPAGEFVGVDFLAEHIAHATGIAEAAGLANIRFVEADFIDLAADWPESFGTFDYVALHGIYSWVSPEVRAAVVRCLALATHRSSLVYNAYNGQPGWLGTVPFQHITHLLKDVTGEPGEAVLADAIGLFEALSAGGAATFRILPGLKARIDSVKTANLGYLVQEYLHDNWRLWWHSEVAKELAEAGLTFAGTATLAETLLPAVLPPPLRDTILARPDDRLRQDLQDFVINQSFRRDIFRRDASGDSAPQDEAIARTRLHLIAPPTGNTLTIEAAFGELTLQTPAFAQIVAALATGPKSVEDLAALPDMRPQGIANTVRILLLLLHARVLAVGAVEPGSAKPAHRLNAAIAQGAADGLPYDHIAAPLLGSAIPASHAELVLLACWLDADGQADETALANAAAERLAHIRHRIERIDAPAFLQRTLPTWRRLGAVV